MHEFVLSMQKLKDETGVTALDVAKAMLDEDMHAPTMYFPSIVHEALMFEPTETESKATLDDAAQKILNIIKRAYENPGDVKDTPKNACIARPDEVNAARNPKIR